MNPPTAFIVEDDPYLGEIFSAALQPHFETEVLGDGDLACSRLRQSSPDIIVLDLNLPGMNGEDILRNIRQNPSLENTPVILCTADNRTAESLLDKADIILLKPVSPMQLQQIALRLSNS